MTTNDPVSPARNPPPQITPPASGKAVAYHQPTNVRPKKPIGFSDLVPPRNAQANAQNPIPGLFG